MSKELVKTFNESNVRIFNIKGNPYFSVLDVCNVLNISNSRMATSRLDSDDVTITDVIDSMGRKQKLTIINEGALYQLIFRSRTKDAKQFRKWVTHEVLPSIRKTGKYSIPSELKQISTENRKALTKAWEDSGIEKRHHFIQLTLQEYKALGFNGKKKKDLDRGELLLLNALESMEMLNLYNNPKEGYYECRDSLKGTAKELPVFNTKDLK